MNQEQRLTDLAERYVLVRRKLDQLRKEAAAIKTEIGLIMRSGSACGWTVYRVGETEVSGYTRSAYRAVRGVSVKMASAKHTRQK